LADAYSILVDSAFIEALKGNNVMVFKGRGKPGISLTSDRYSYEFNY